MATRAEQLNPGPSHRGNHHSPMTRALAKGQTAVQVDAMRKVQAIMELRGRGLTWQKCADAVGYADAASAMNAAKRYMAQTRNEMHTSIEEYRELEVARLDRALVEITEIGFDREQLPERRLVALEAMRRNIESRAKLMNLYPTQQVEVITISQIERRVAELSHQLGVPLPRELIEIPDGEWDENGNPND